MNGYVAFGEKSGCCGHTHKKLETAHKCAKSERNKGKSDRQPHQLAKGEVKPLADEDYLYSLSLDVPNYEEI